TVSVPDPPWVIVKVPGDRLVTVGGCGVTWTVLVALPPFSDTVMRALPTLAAVTGTGTLVCPAAKATDAGTVATPVLALLAVSVTVRSMTVTFGVKSVLRTICTPFRTTVAAVTRCAPVASPFTKWKRKGAPIDGGTVKESVTVTGCPVARTYCLGPKSSWSGVAWEERGRGRISPPTRRARTQAERIHR